MIRVKVKQDKGLDLRSLGNTMFLASRFRMMQKKQG
jgi:hypothetical protein